MKVAVVLPGHVRTFDDCWSSWVNNIVVPNSWECDYYVHTYALAQRVESLVIDAKNKNYTTDSEAESRARVERAIAAINPIACVVDEGLPDVNAEYEALRSLGLYRGKAELALSQLCQTYKLRSAYQLLQPHVDQYDLVVRSRFDLQWPQPVIFQKPQPREILCNKRPITDHDAACDLFGVMSPEGANVYFNLHDTLVPRAQRGMRKYNLEIHLGMHLREQKITLVHVDCRGMWIKRF